MSNFHRGPWADTAQAAIIASLAEVQVDPAEYIECQYGEGSKFVGVDPTRPTISVDVVYSESRQQYRAELRKGTPE